MDTDLKGQNLCTPEFFDISDDDIFKAMKEIPGYLDTTPGDFKDLYRFAYKQTIERLTRSVKVDVMS